MERRKLLPATDANKALVPGFLRTKAAFGATEHERALMSALALEPDVIFLPTRGGDPVLTDQQIRAIARLASPRTAIHCIHFGSRPLQDANNFLARLAAATGGEYGYVDVNQRRKQLRLTASRRRALGAREAHASGLRLNDLSPTVDTQSRTCK